MLRDQLRTRRRSERGITMLEVTLAAALTLVVFGSVLGLLDSFVRVESGFEDRIDSRADLNLIVEEFARDARSGGSPWAGGTSAEMAGTVTIPRVDASGSVVLVRWSISADGTLSRTVVHDSGPDEVRELVTGLDADGSGLRYHDANGVELLPGSDSAADISACTARVGLDLVAANDPGSRSSASATLRNAAQEESC